VRVSEQLRRQIEMEIALGTLRPGDHLDEQTLAKRFKVSRTPAREVLLQLAANGIVRFVPRRGAVIVAMSPQLAVGMVEVLTALEAEAAALAARRMSTAERDALRDLHLKTLTFVDAQENNRYIQANDVFHKSIYDGARNAYLSDKVKETRSKMRFFRHRSLTHSTRLRASWNEHAKVVDAIARGSELDAYQAMRSHISVGGTVFADMVSAMTVASDPPFN